MKTRPTAQIHIVGRPLFAQSGPMPVADTRRGRQPTGRDDAKSSTRPQRCERVRLRLQLAFSS